MPLVSVIVPVYNGTPYLAEAINSALAQSYKPTEVIVVDDGSTDETPQVLETYGDRIRVLRQANGGAASARNTALAAARGEYIAFLDADDMWAPHKLRAQVSHLNRHPEVDLVFSRWVVVGGPVVDPGAIELDPDEPCPVIEQESGWIYNALLLDCVVHTTTVVMRSRLVDKIGLFEPDLKRGQDYDFWLRASRVTPIHKLDAVLSIYRIHEASSTRRPMAVNYPGIILERALARWGRTGPDGGVTPAWKLRRRLARSWASFGYDHARAGNKRVALAAFGRSLAKQPVQPRLWALALASVAPGVPRLLGWR